MMKNLFPASLIILLLLVSACEYQEPVEEPQGGELYSFAVTGIRSSISYTMESSGRSTPDQVSSLILLVLAEDGHVAYETRYYSWEGQGAIPDTIFIPALGEGQYKIVASTSDYFYYDFYEDGSIADGDSMNISGLVLPAYAISAGPIYVGFQEIFLNDETDLVQIDMANISAKITFKMANGETLAENQGLDLSIEGVDGFDYDLENGEFRPAEYSTYLYGSVDRYQNERSVYVLPQTLVTMNVNFYDWWNGANWSQSMEFETPLPLEAGDAITFSVDMERLMEGAGSGVLNFEDVDWNDLGEIMVP